MAGPGPAVLHPYDPGWPVAAQQLVNELRAVAPNPSWLIEHIGSTAVPGLAAKNILDLQIRVPTLPPPDELEATLGSLGYIPATGSRPDSPGVYRDGPRGSEQVPDEVWQKRLFVRAEGARVSVILHVRRMDSPFGRYTVWFRDWLRAHDDERARYEAIKRRLAQAHAGDADYDDYTRDKTAYLDEVQPAFEAWARGERNEIRA
jgi:GrpB-like predicted nucleotidyltransferase (UPF0157 family)